MAGAERPTEGSAPHSADELRRQAEARVDALSAAGATHGPHAPEEIAAIVHELRVQIELEMQNGELRSAQLELTVQREKYLELFEHAPAGYVTLTAKGLVADANVTAARLLGVERALLVGQPFTAFVIAADRDVYYTHRRRLQQTGEPQAWDVRLQRLSGESGAEPKHFWARLEGRRRDEDGDPGAFWVTFTDITAQKEAEQARAEAKDLLDRVGAISLTGGWEFDVASGRLAWTDEVYAIYGVDHDFDPSDVDRIIGFCSPETRPAFAAAFRRALREGEPYDLDVELERADGERRWLHTSARPLFQDGAVVTVAGTVMDITERKAVETALRRTEAMRDTAERIARIGSVRLDLTTGKAQWSPETYRLFGMTADEFDGDSQVVFDARFHPEDRIRVEQATARALRTGVISPADYRVVWPDGSEHVLHGEGTTEYGADGTAVAITGYFRDVTEERRASDDLTHFNDVLEQRVMQRTSQLEAANKELEAFVYSASHDLRAPLRAIDGFSQMIVEDAADRLDEDDLAHLQRVRAAARRMGLLIDHLLSLARSARQDLLREPVDLSSMAMSVLSELQDAHPKRDVTVVVAPGLIVEADSALLHVVLTNLLANAWKFTSRHETARIEVGAVDDDGKRAFFVKDDGAGFDPVKAEHLFGAFQRYHATDDFEGDGIGLAIVQRLIARHGGSVWVEAEVERGATFFFTLPPPLAD
jgi:PAS domain S-box-containing protein